MAKSKETILNQMEVSADSDLTSLLQALSKYSVVTDSEKNLIKQASVQPLPTIVRNQEQNLKQRMHGIVTDENVGAIALMNKRNTLLEQILLKFNETLTDENDVIDIIEENSEEVGLLDIANSENYDLTSENQVPTTKAVFNILNKALGEFEHVYVGDTSPSNTLYDTWFDTSDSNTNTTNEEQPMMFAMRGCANYGTNSLNEEELTFNYCDDDEELTFNTEQEELTFNKE